MTLGVIDTIWKINLEPQNHQFFVETHLPTPKTARVYVNLLEVHLCRLLQVYILQKNMSSTYINLKIYPTVIKHGLLENGPFIGDFPSYFNLHSVRGFSSHGADDTISGIHKIS